MTSQEIGIAILIGGASGAFVVWARELMFRAQERVWHEREIELSNQVTSSPRETDQAVRVAAAYREGMRKHGLVLVNRKTGREVWVRESIWTDGPADTQ